MTKDMFARFWEQRHAQSQAETATLRARVKELDGQIAQLVDRIVDASSDTVIAAYEARIKKLEREKLLIAEKLQNSGGSQRPFGEVFELALGFLASPWNIWKNGDYAERQTVLRLAFDDRLSYCWGIRVSNPKTSIVFRMLEGANAMRSKMAERAGIRTAIRLPVYTLSRRAPSTTRPPLRIGSLWVIGAGVARDRGAHARISARHVR